MAGFTVLDVLYSLLLLDFEKCLGLFGVFYQNTLMCFYPSFKRRFINLQAK